MGQSAVDGEGEGKGKLRWVGELTRLEGRKVIRLVTISVMLRARSWSISSNTTQTKSDASKV